MALARLDVLVRSLMRLPGVGKRSAMRYALFLLEQKPHYASELANALTEALQNIRQCAQCHMLTEQAVCTYCEDRTRNKEQLCIVHHTQDVMMLEQTSLYKGRFFVLHGALDPIAGVTIEHIGLPTLWKLLQEQTYITEVILALNSSHEGEMTGHMIASHVQEHAAHITVNRLAQGVPMGRELEFLDKLTLAHAFANRTRLPS